MAQTSRRQDERSSDLRRWLKRALLAVLASLAIAVGVVVAVDLGWERDRIMALAIEMAEERTGLEISIEESMGRLSRGIELHNVRVDTPRNPLLEIESLRVVWSPLSFLSQDQWIADSIRIEGWSLRLHRSQDGSWSGLEELIARLSGDGVGTEIPDDSSRLGPSLLVRRMTLGEGEVELRVDRRSKDPDQAELDSDAAGPLRASFRMTGLVRALRAGPSEALTVESGQVEAQLVEVDSGVPAFDRSVEARLSLVAREDRLESFEAELFAPGSKATVRAAGRFANLDQLHVELSAKDLSPWSDWLQTSKPLHGQVDATLDLAGPPRALQGSLVLRAHHVAIEELAARELDLSITLETPLDQIWEDPMTASARVQLRTRGLDPGWLDPIGLPSGLADIELEGNLDQGVFDLQHGKLSMAGLEAEGTGRGSRTHIEHSELHLTLSDVGPWLRILQPDLDVSGPLEGDGKLEGAIAQPVGRFSLRSSGLRLDGQNLGALDLEIERKIAEAAELTISLGPRSKPLADGHLRIDLEHERVDFELSGRAEAWTALFDPGVEVRGDLEAQGFFEGQREDPAFSVSLVSVDTFLGDDSLGRVELAASSEPGGVIEIAKLHIAGESGDLELSDPTTLRIRKDRQWSLDRSALRLATGGAAPGAVGSLALAATGEGTTLLSVETWVDEVPLAISNRFRPNGPVLGGRLNGHARWSRSQTADGIAGRLEWIEPRIAEVSWDRAIADWTRVDDGIDFTVETGIAEHSPLILRGRLALPTASVMGLPGFSLDGLALRGELDGWDLASLESLSPRWMRRVAGLISGSIEIESHAGRIALGGRATVAQGGFTVPLLRHRFSPVEAVVKFTDRAIVIESLQLGQTGAGATLVGKIELTDGGEPTLDGSLLFDHLAVSRSPLAWLDLAGELSLAGDLARPILRGALSIEEGQFGVPSSSDPILKEIRIASRSGSDSMMESTTREKGLFDQADVDVLVSLPGTTRVRGEGANLFVEGEARLLKPSPEPLRIQGQARVVNGTYRFQGRRFRVRRGRVLMTGSEILDPLLDVEAYLEVADIVAIIEVSGPLSQPIVQLRSEPPLSEQDVLSYVLFGRPSERTASTADSSFEAAAAQLAAGVAESELRDLLGESMPIDAIEVRADEEGRVSEFGFGRYLGPRLYLRYAHVLGDQPSDRAGVEYRLNDNFSIGNSVSTSGDVGIELILRHDF